MLADYLSRDRIQIDGLAHSIEEAVLLAGKLLTATGCAGPGYPQAMVQTVRELGDAAVMAPYTALPHAAFSLGGLRPAVAAVRLARPLDFGGPNGPVRLILGFCGADGGSHMQVLSALAAFLSKPESVPALLGAATEEDFYRVLCS